MQIRMAKAALGWSNERLAGFTGLHKNTINKAENNEARPATFALLKAVFESAGVQFLSENGGPSGVRVREPKIIAMEVDAASPKGDYKSLLARYMDESYEVRISGTALAVLAGPDLDPDNPYIIEAYDTQILIAAERAIDAGRADKDHVVLLTSDDFG